MHLRKRPLPILALAVLALLLLRRLSPIVRGQDQDEDEQQEAITNPSHVSVEHGQTVVTLDSQLQARLGVQLTTLQAVRATPTVSVPARVLAVDSLVADRSRYRAIQATRQKAQIAVDAARPEFERQQSLYRNDRNASQQAMQMARAALDSAQVDLSQSDDALALQVQAIRQSWGPVIARWVVSNSPALQRLLSRQDLLVQVTFPADLNSAPPPRGIAALPAGATAPVRFLSLSPGVDPRVQGRAFFYTMSARAGLGVGSTFTVSVPSGGAVTGTDVPQSAVVLWHGSAWVYREIRPGVFTRTAVVAREPLANGVLAGGALMPGAHIVLTGAETLLSEEFLSLIQAEG